MHCMLVLVPCSNEEWWITTHDEHYLLGTLDYYCDGNTGVSPALRGWGNPSVTCLVLSLTCSRAVKLITITARARSAEMWVYSICIISALSLKLLWLCCKHLTSLFSSTFNLFIEWNLCPRLLCQVHTQHFTTVVSAKGGTDGQGVHGC